MGVCVINLGKCFEMMTALLLLTGCLIHALLCLNDGQHKGKDE